MKISDIINFYHPIRLEALVLLNTEEAERYILLKHHGKNYTINMMTGEIKEGKTEIFARAKHADETYVITYEDNILKELNQKDLLESTNKYIKRLKEQYKNDVDFLRNIVMSFDQLLFVKNPKSDNMDLILFLGDKNKKYELSQSLAKLRDDI